MAFSRTGDAATDDFENAKVIAVYGAVDVGALGGRAAGREGSGLTPA